MGIIDSIFKPNIKKLTTRKNINGLLRALCHKDSQIRIGAASALIEFSSEETIYSLTRAIDNEKDSTVKNEIVLTILNAIKMLQKNYNNNTLKILEDLIVNCNEEMVILEALNAIYIINNNECIDILRKAIINKNDRVRIASIIILSKLGDIDSIISVLNDEVYIVREQAVKLLADQYNDKSIQALISVYLNFKEDTIIKSMAMESLLHFKELINDRIAHNDYVTKEDDENVIDIDKAMDKVRNYSEKLNKVAEIKDRMKAAIEFKERNKQEEIGKNKKEWREKSKLIKKEIIEISKGFNIESNHSIEEMSFIIASALIFHKEQANSRKASVYLCRNDRLVLGISGLVDYALSLGYRLININWGLLDGFFGAISYCTEMAMDKDRIYYGTYKETGRQIMERKQGYPKYSGGYSIMDGEDMIKLLSTLDNGLIAIDELNKYLDR